MNIQHIGAFRVCTTCFEWIAQPRAQQPIAEREQEGTSGSGSGSDGQGSDYDVGLSRFRLPVLED